MSKKIPFGEIPRFYKAIVGFVAPGAVLITAAVQDSSPGGAAITTAEWVTAVCACVVTAAGVYSAPWKPKA
jgi:hypothetical protein